MDDHDITVRLQALGGTWETLGAERFRYVVPENVQYTYNEWGPDTASFVLRRDAVSVHADLSAWTPVEIELAGMIAWDGRIKETPTADGEDPTISVQCEGWQYHLDDDVYAANYVHTRMSDFVDSRSSPLANLATDTQVYNAQIGDGQILLGLDQGATGIVSTGVAATVDLGPGCSAIRMSIDAASSFNSATITMFVMGSDTSYWNDASRLDAIAAKPLNDASFVAANTVQTFTASIGAAKRYWSVLFFYNAATGAAAADFWIRVTGFRIYGSASYESGGQSILKADTVIKDAAAHTVFLTDTSLVQAGTFNIPEFALDGAHSPREVITAVNAYENYEIRVAVGRKLYFAPRASAATYEIGEWSGADFTDESENSGEDIFNDVLVEGTAPDGTQLTVQRSTVDALGITATVLDSHVATNPSFDTNTTGWTLQIFGTNTGTITRDTGVFQSSPASGRFNWTFGTGAENDLDTFFLGPQFFRGVPYVISVWIRGSTTGGTATLSVLGGIGLNSNSTKDITIVAGAWTNYLIPWVPKVNFVPNQSPTFRIAVKTGTTVTSPIYVDDVSVLLNVATLVDRRGFVRTKILPVDSSITATSANRIGDLFLTAHQTTPFRGGFRAVGQGGIRNVLGGVTVHPGLIQPGKIVRCSHRINPDTGAWGRDGRIAAIQYDHDNLTAQVALDENRAGLEALLSRLAVVTGQFKN